MSESHLPGTSTTTAARSVISVLPKGWDVERDLLVLVGADGIGAARLFKDAGQVRILSYLLPGDPEPANDLAGVARDDEGLRRYIRGLGGKSPVLASLRPMPGSTIDPATLQRLGEDVGRTLKAWQVARNTVDESGSLWLGQIAQNLDKVALHPSIDELTGAFQDRPCVIVSPGPSLDKNIQQLKEVAGRVVIMTCPHALHALEKVGVIPDIVVVGDARGLAWQYGDYDFTRVPALVLMSCASPELFDLPAKQTFTYGFHPEIDMWAYGFLGKDALLPSGGSVACTELSLALRMGCSRVAFIGQDLAFEGERVYSADARDGQSVANISEDGQSFVLERNLPVDKHNRWGTSMVPVAPHRVFDVPGYHGGTVKTWPAFKIFIDWFTSVLTSGTVDATVANCTEGGAFIEGMDHRPLAAFLEELGPEGAIAPPAQIELRVAAWDRDPAVAAMREGLAQVLAKLESCRAAARACLKALNSARGNPGKLGRLSKEEARLNREIKRVPFLAVAAQREVRSAMEAGAEAKDMQASMVASERLFRVVLGAVNSVYAPLSESYRALGSAD